ncbi:divergent PAP2 family protein [Marinithermofilum abyssi]|uniref:divergent PAP2 family protein n=1 Tax=Marinithermofilum abyssi TaxID=1571185 RepID=UPI00166B0977
MNLPLFSALLAMVSAQIFKVFWHRQHAQSWNWGLLFRSGGIPSSHSSLVSTLSVSMYLSYGLHSPFFTISMVITVIVLYDSIGIRRQIGEQGSILYTLVHAVKESGFHPEMETPTYPVQRRVHTLLGMVGGVTVGTCIAWLLYWIVS